MRSEGRNFCMGREPQAIQSTIAALINFFVSVRGIGRRMDMLFKHPFCQIVSFLKTLSPNNAQRTCTP